MIKYLGSKRRLVPVLGELLARASATTALDLFTGTTRVAQEFKRRGAFVTAVDSARYAHVLARCHVETDATHLERRVLLEALAALNALPGRPGYFTETFCERSRFFQPANGERIDAIRNALDEDFAGTQLYPVLLTSLLEAADRVDSTAGVQMAYMKSWAPRSYRPLELREPLLWPGRGHAVRADACQAVHELAPVDVAYLDPPYNQHRYFTNYHVWETLVAWDAPEHYGVACKRLDSRDPSTRSAFNGRRSMPDALRQVVRDVQARVVIVSYNNEAWLSLEELVELGVARGAAVVLGFDSRRYIGSQIGIYSPTGERVGAVSHVRNTEYLLVAGPRRDVEAMVAPFSGDIVCRAGGSRERRLVAPEPPRHAAVDAALTTSGPSDPLRAHDPAAIA